LGDLVEDEVHVDGRRISRAGISARSSSGLELTGSSAAVVGRVEVRPLETSAYELLERIAVLTSIAAPRTRERRDRSGRVVGEIDALELFPESDAPTEWTYARSNGVALHTRWEAACDVAFRELAERDRVLAAWYGHGMPVVIDDWLDRPRAGLYDWKLVRFPPRPQAFAPTVEVAGVFGFPRQADAPMAVGYGAHSSAAAAAAIALREATQVLAFMWGEPREEVAFSPTALYHLEHFQSAEGRDALLNWIEHGHPRAEIPAAASAVSFVDLTPSFLAGQYRVVRAVSSGAHPLAFGRSPFTRHLPAHLRVHPIA